MNYGFQNEIDFENALNNKLFKNLSIMLQIMLEDLYERRIDDNELIIAFRNKEPYKTDLFVKINNEVKKISLKMGHSNSVHVSRITDFIHFLIENKIERLPIIEYLKYHYADGTTNGKGTMRMSAKEYQDLYKFRIRRINDALDNEKFINACIQLFVISNTNIKTSIDIVIHGTVNDFLWIKRNDIFKVINRKIDSKSVHIGKLFVQPMDRCLNYNPKFEKKRFCVQIKWHSLFDDIIWNMNDNSMHGY